MKRLLLPLLLLLSTNPIQPTEQQHVDEYPVFYLGCWIDESEILMLQLEEICSDEDYLCYVETDTDLEEYLSDDGCDLNESHTSCTICFPQE